MKALTPLFFLLMGSCITGWAQVSDDFSDGNYADQPVWYCDSSSWRVNAQLQLQSNHFTANSQFQIVTRSSLALEASWEWQMQLHFNTSSANYVDVFLMADDSLLSSTTNTGYFVRIGNSTDEISFYRKSGSSLIKLIDGTDGITNNSFNILRIRVTRNAAHEWTLYRDQSGSGQSYYKEGSATDSSHKRSAFFGILVRQSTVAGFAGKHFFDSIKIERFIPDTLPPVMMSLQAADSNTAELLFNETVDGGTAADTSHYTLGTTQQKPLQAAVVPDDSRKIRIQFREQFESGANLPLHVRGITDAAGNPMRDTMLPLVFYRPVYGDVVIHEIMADPSPPVGLPEVEWVELKNTCNHPIQLKGWRIGDPTTVSNVFPDVLLLPGEMILLSGSTSATAAYPGIRVLTISGFPSLNNEGELLYVLDASGQVIHAVAFETGWYSNALKQQGGWSLEMRDASQACKGGDNWTASEDPSGGTPGRANSVQGSNPDHTGPKVLRAYPMDSLHLVLILSEPADRITATNTRIYQISPEIINPLSVSVSSYTGNQVTLTLPQPLRRGVLYEITVQGLRDCAGNLQEGSSMVQAGLPETAAAQDIVIHELLFNPPFDGADYVELYNRSSKIIDLSKLYLANRNTLGAVSSIVACSPEPRLLLPGAYVVLSEDIPWIIRQYPLPHQDALLQISSLPAYPDDKGTVVLLNEQGLITDELNYSEQWHFPLINHPEGVALERISAAEATQDAGNWHSAAGPWYGTPGTRNSQAASPGIEAAAWQLTTRMISPDNDGRDDYALITYRFPQPGYVANIVVFDAAGRKVRQLQRSALCGKEGSFRWDGLGEFNRPLPGGIYIIWAEVFNTDGRVQRFKNAVAVVSN